MYAAILHAVGGDPTAGEGADGTLESSLETRPYVDIEATQYLDGHTVYEGTLAGYVADEQPTFHTDADPEARSLTTDTEDVETPVVAEMIADLEAGWCGVDTSDGAELLQTVLLSQVSCIPEATELDLAAVVEGLPADTLVNGVVTSEDTDEGDARDAASAQWHDEAPRSANGIPTRGLSQVSIAYRWDGHSIDATLAASGYVAVYNDKPPEVVARWISEVVWPHAAHGEDVDGQADLSDEPGHPGGESA